MLTNGRPVLPPSPAAGYTPGFLARFARFGVVGTGALVADVGLFNLLAHAGTAPPMAGNPLLAKAISTAVAIVLTWLGNRSWTFRHHRRRQVGREFVVYVAMSLVGLGMSLLALWVSRALLHLDSAVADNLAANVVGLAVGSAFKFWAYQNWVFTESRAQRTGGGDVIESSTPVR